MRYRIVQTISRRLVVTELTDDTLIPALEVRGYAMAGINRNRKQREELQEQPIFDGLVGPMWDGDAIRYEDAEAYCTLGA